eukprot:scaffold3984_cov339-Pinguiococcus_pyrenoidosus.AAC.1
MELGGKITQTFVTGNSVAFTSGVSYSTPTGVYGSFGDLLITPTLSIRTITVLPIGFNASAVPGECGGFARAEASRWQLLDGTAGDPDCESKSTQEEKDACALDKALEAYLTAASQSELTIADGETDAALRDRLRDDYAREATQDTSWNALAVHSVWDVLYIRLPQLQERCQEEHSRLACFAGSTASSELSTLANSFDDFKWCNPVISGSADASCVNYEDFGSDETDTEDLSLARLEATLEGIKGWRQALLLNEQLKDRAEPARAGELIQSPLITGRDGEQLLTAEQQDEQEEMEEDFQSDVVDPIKTSNPSEAELNGIQDKTDEIQGTSVPAAEASIIAFTGGGSAT